MYIVTSQSDKNKGKWYYGYDGQWLDWVPMEKIGQYMATLQNDGAKWKFPPGHIEPEVVDKLKLTNGGYQPQAYQNYPQAPPPQFYNPPNPPPPQVQAPPPPKPSYDHVYNTGESTGMTPEQIAMIVTKSVTEVLRGNKDLWSAFSKGTEHLENLSNHLSDLVEMKSAANQLKKRSNELMERANDQRELDLQNQGLQRALKKRKTMTTSINLMHPMPGDEPVEDECIGEGSP